MSPKIGIVIPILNESSNLPKLIESIVSQSEYSSIRCVIFVDGGSTDNSIELVEDAVKEYPTLHLLNNPQKKTPYGFNIGIKKCLKEDCTIISIFSGHSYLDADYVKNLIQINNNQLFDILGSVHRFVIPSDINGKMIVCLSENKLGRGQRYYSEMKILTQTPIAYCPAIKSYVFDQIGFFDEKLERNQDNDFTTRALQKGFKIYTSPELIYHYSPRSTIKKLITQMYKNGFWIGVNPKGHGMKYFLPFIFLITSVLSILFVVIFNSLFIPLVICTILYYGLLLFYSLPELKVLKLYTFLLPFLISSTHIAYGIGILNGLITRSK